MEANVKWLKRPHNDSTHRGQGSFHWALCAKYRLADGTWKESHATPVYFEDHAPFTRACARGPSSRMPRSCPPHSPPLPFHGADP